MVHRFMKFHYGISICIYMFNLSVPEALCDLGSIFWIQNICPKKEEWVSIQIKLGLLILTPRKKWVKQQGLETYA